ncbi:MAG: VOC family protein [Pseudomonadota bacterium]
MAAAAGFDHLIAGVDDLERAADEWRRAGFTVTPRGRHIGWGTANYCIMFPNEYVELLGVLDPTKYLYGLDRFLADHGEGLLGVAFATTDPDETYRALEEIGQQGDPPKDLARFLDLPEGTVEPRFHLVHPRDSKAFGVSAFFCRHLTPELVRKPAWLDHPNGAVGIAEIETNVPDLAGLAPRYQAIFGPSAVDQSPRRVCVQTGTTRVVLKTGTPAADRITIKVRDLDATDRWMKQADVAALGSGLSINGMQLTFVEA